MTIVESFANYLSDLLDVTRGVDLFVSDAPSSAKALNSLWWIVAFGGAPVTRNVDGGLSKSYQVQVFYRSRSNKDVYDQMFALEESLNCAGCVQLEGYDVLEVSTNTFPTDDDIDSEGRKVGLLQITISIFKECDNVNIS
jgi:hypothetical protein